MTGFRARGLKALMALLLLLGLNACQIPVNPLVPTGLASTSLSDSLPDWVPYQLILRPRSERSLQVLKALYAASERDRLQVGEDEYVLLDFEPQRVQAQVGARCTASGAKADHCWTQALFAQIWQQQAELFWHLDFNWQAPIPPADQPELDLQPSWQTLAAPPTETPPLFDDLLLGTGSAYEGWWQRETGLERAWQYSLGQGVTAAYLDQGFVRGHPELETRLVINGANNQTDSYRDQQPSNIELPRGDHGTASLLVGFAARGNGIPSVGVAPEARFIPYVAASVWDVARALQRASQDKVDLIGMNFAFPLYPRWQEHADYYPYQLLKAVFASLQERGLPVVVPAHNYGEPVSGGVREWVPIAWHDQFDFMIPVGGTEITRTQEVKVWFSPNLLTGINARGSNYGPGLIYAPATALDIANTDPDSLKPGTMNGTSAACPFVVGTVALLKALEPQLSPVAVRSLLLDSARPVDASELLQNSQATVPFVQVDRALELALQRQGQDPAQALAQVWTGHLEPTRPPASPGYFLQTDEGQSLKLLNSEYLQRRAPLLVHQAVSLRAWHRPQIPAEHTVVDGWSVLTLEAQ